jgi:hypothetical protein
MALDTRRLNDRITFLAATVTAGLITSVLPCLFSPSSPLCAGAPGLLNYAGDHFFLTVALWIAVFAAGWLVAGPRLVRPRQNLSTKLRLLTWLGVGGILIDNTVSLYQFQNSPAASMVRLPSSSLLPGLAGRSLLYATIFAAVAGLSCLIAVRQKPTVTPPPRFGRE